MTAMNKMYICCILPTTDLALKILVFAFFGGGAVVLHSPLHGSALQAQLLFVAL